MMLTNSNSLTKTIEIDQIDTRYKEYRLQNKQRNKELLFSIQEEGILDPLEGVFIEDSFVLIDGFKRLRCATILNIGLIPIVEMAEDEVSAILKLLKISSQSLHIYEEAKLVQKLHNVYKLTVREIAQKLHRSSGWVSTRFTFLKETTPYTQKQVFLGQFPARCAAYTLRQFTRVNKIPHNEIDKFVESVSCKKLSTREIDLLANAYFKGGKESKKQIEELNFSWVLTPSALPPFIVENNLSEDEKQILASLSICQKHIGKIILKVPLLRAQSQAYLVEAKLLSEGTKGKISNFVATLDAIGNINEEKRNAIWRLYQEGTSISELSRMAKVDKKTVKRVIDLKGMLPSSFRKEKIIVDQDLLREVYKECHGWTPRMHEILTEEKGIKIGYSTLTAMLRKLGLKKN